VGALVKLKATITNPSASAAPKKYQPLPVASQSCTSITGAIWENCIVENLRELDVRAGT